MAKISHLIADPDTTSKLKACFPDFVYLKEKVKQKLAENSHYFQTLVISPEISDVPESTRFLFLFSKFESDQISCKGYSYCGDKSLFQKYISILLAREEVDLEKVVFIEQSAQLLPAQFFSSLSLAELSSSMNSDDLDENRRYIEFSEFRTYSKNVSQYVFVSLVLFAFVYGYTSKRAQLIVNKTRDAIFDVSTFLDFSTPEVDSDAMEVRIDLDSDLGSARARFAGDESFSPDENLVELDPKDPRDRLDILMNKLEIIENEDQVSPEEIEKIEKEIDKAFDLLAEAEDSGK